MSDEKKSELEHVRIPEGHEIPSHFREALIASGMREVKCECCRMTWLTRGTSDICPPCRKLN